MKITLVMITLICSLSALGAIDGQSIKGQVDVKAFYVEDDGRLGGQLSYLVDGTTGNCYAIFNGKGNSMVSVSCKSLMRINAIKTYLETRKTSK